MKEKNKMGIQNSPIGKNGNQEKNTKISTKTSGDNSPISTGEVTNNHSVHNGDINNSGVTARNNVNNDFLSLLDMRSKLRNQMDAANQELLNCSICNKAMIKQIKNCDESVFKKYQYSTYNGHTKQALVWRMDEDKEFCYKQVRIGIGLKSECNIHNDIFNNAKDLFSRYVSINKRINVLENNK